MLKKVMAFLLVLASSSSLGRSEDKKQFSELDSDSEQLDDSSCSDRNCGIVLNKEEGYSDDRNFNLFFSGKKIDCCSFAGDGITIKYIKRNVGEVKVSLQIFSKETILFIRDNETQIVLDKVFFCQDTNGKVFYSSISMDSARKLAGYDSKNLYSGVGGISIGGANLPVEGPRTGISF